MCWQNNKNKKQQICHCRDRVHYAVSDTTPEHPLKREGNNVLKVCRWSIAAGKRPVPFRTRKLSLHTLMVLQPGGCGRVSHRRHQTTKTQQNTTKKRTVYHRPLLFAFYQPSQLVEAVGTTHIRVAPTASFCVYTHRSRPAHQPHNDGFNIRQNGKSATNPQPFLLPPLPSESRLWGPLRL